MAGRCGAPLSSPVSTSGCGVPLRRQLEDPYSSPATWIDSLMEGAHPQFGHDPFGRIVAHLGDADDPLQCAVLEPELNRCRSGLGGQTPSPVCPPQPPADLDRRQHLRQEVGTERPVNPASSCVKRISTANRPKPRTSHPRSMASIPLRVCRSSRTLPSPIHRMTSGSALTAARGTTSSSRRRRRSRRGVSSMTIRAFWTSPSAAPPPSPDAFDTRPSRPDGNWNSSLPAPAPTASEALDHWGMAVHIAPWVHVVAEQGSLPVDLLLPVTGRTFVARLDGREMRDTDSVFQVFSDGRGCRTTSGGTGMPSPTVCAT